jgi:hypothetical protein
MDDIDREAVREVIRQYRKEYRENIEPVIDKILEKVHNGQRVYEAVSDALSETPFFTANRQAVIDVVCLAACAGYGVLPKMVANMEGIKGKLLSESWTPDKMPLSKRLHGTDAAMRRTIIDTIQSAMTMTKSVKDIAMDLYDGYNSGKTVIRQAELPRYLDKVVTYARWASNGEQEMVQPVLDAAAQAEKLIGSVDTPALKAAYKNLIQAAKLFEPKAIDKAVHVAMEEKSRYHAERIARTEAARAWYEGYMAKTEDDEDIWGYKYCLSSRHYLCPYDQCDVLANANMGYGKGIYPKGKQPSLPRHPHCMCMLQAVYHWEVDKDQTFKPEGARDYIDSVTASQQQDLFGIKGAQEYRVGGDWQKLLRGFEGFGEQPAVRLKKEDFQLKLIAQKPLPNYEKAIIPDAKIFNYALNMDHPVGRNKAVVFDNVLGYNKSNGEKLISAIREHLPQMECISRKGKYGVQYSGKIDLTGPSGRTARVKVAWQIDNGTDFPKLTSIYVDE